MSSFKDNDMMKVAVIERSSQSSLMCLKATLPPVKALRWFSTAFQIMEERLFPSPNF